MVTVYDPVTSSALDNGQPFPSIFRKLGGLGIVLAIARAKGLFRMMLDRSGVAEKIGRQHIFPTVHAGAQAFFAT